MARYSTADIRNIALVGHGGAGKTTLVEALLHRAGAIKAPGTVERGTTVSDFDPMEKSHQHSLYSSVQSFDYEGRHINLIDTPGYPDFLGRAMAVLPAVETAAVVINAQTGVQMVTQRMMEWARARELDRLVIVNQIDADNVDLGQCLAQIQEAFGQECLPLNLPADGGRAVVDCFFEPSAGPTDFSSVEEAHTRLIDQVVEVDEALMEVYLEQGQAISPEQLHDPFELALREGHLVPVCFVSARSGAGLHELLQVLVRLMPNPFEGNPPAFLKGEGPQSERVAIVPDRARHALAHVFKIAVDPFVGRLGVFRIHQGTISKDSQLFVGDGRKPIKVGHLFTLLGKESLEVPAGIPGDICALAKVEELHFDAVLHDSHEEDRIHLRSIDFPVAMHGIAIAAKSRGDEQRLSDALHKLAAEDPSVRLDYSPALNETVLRGLGELHVRVMIETMRERFNVDVETRPPKIDYRETITAPAEGHHRHKKQTGGAGQFGEVFLRVRPLGRGEGYRFVDAVVGGVIPRQFIPAAEKGIQQAMGAGVLAGYPIQDLEVTLYDGKYHPVDSKEVAFIAAGKKGFIDAVKKARPVVLEPIVNIRITIPNSSMGDTTADLSGKRGRVSSTKALPGGQIEIEGQVPLSEIEQYPSQLKSMTGGHGSYTIEFSHYDPVPARIQQQLVAAFKPAEAED